MKNVMEAVIVNGDDMMASLMAGDERAIAAARSIAKWLAEMARRAKQKRFLCLDCDVAFHARRLPEAFAMNLPFAEDCGSILVTGICQRCVEEKEGSVLLQKYVERARVYYPDLTILERGQA
jgi:hypothetical protein